MRNLSILLAAAAPRAVCSVPMAHGNDPSALVQQINAAFADFRSDQNARMSRLEAGFDQQAGALAAARLGGGSQEQPQRVGLSSEVRRVILAQMRGLPFAARDMETGSSPDGGFTVPEQMDNNILPFLRTLSPLRQWATTATIDRGGKWEKIITVIGGKSAWAGELDERGETDTPVLGKIEIQPEELMAQPALTNHVLEDSQFDLEAFLMDDLATEMSLQEGIAFVSGDGVKKPRGFLTLPTATTADATRPFGTLQHVLSGTTGTIVTDDLLNLLTPLRAVYRAGQGVGWIMNSTTEGRLRAMKDGQGQYIWRQGLEMGAPSMLLGYPVGIDEAMPDVAANSLPVAFGNWRRGYAIVDKIGTKLIRDNVTRKGWTKLYFYRRVGGHPLDTNAIKLLKIKP